jgi:hypothetical protein
MELEMNMNMLMKMKEILKDNTVDKGAGKRYYHGNIITCNGETFENVVCCV